MSEFSNTFRTKIYKEIYYNRSVSNSQSSNKMPGVSEEDEDEGPQVLILSSLAHQLLHIYFQDDVVNFKDFVRVLAHFRPIKKNADKNPLNSREDKLRCKWDKFSMLWLE